MDVKDLENRFAYHKPDSDARIKGHETVRASCYELAKLLNVLVPEGREKSLATTHLEDVMMWANAGIARAAIY